LKDPKLVEGVLHDLETSSLDEKTKKLFRYIKKVADDAASVTRDDVLAVKNGGWSEAAIYDALTVASLFSYYNTWIDGAGVQDMSSADYQNSGRRLATMGYLMEISLYALKNRWRK
jgi:hypothetical protein